MVEHKWTDTTESEKDFYNLRKPKIPITSAYKICTTYSCNERVFRNDRFCDRHNTYDKRIQEKIDRLTHPPRVKKVS